MPARTRFGIVGAYGETGRVVVSELVKSAESEVLTGGRDLEKGKALAAKFGSRVSAVQVDVSDAGSLDAFCGRCSIVVNCAGPVMLLQDRVAQAAFRQHCHYIDVAGLSLVQERMLAHSRAIENLGLSFVVSAGWLPGITELLPVYAHAQARTRMDSIDSLTEYFGDSGEWSPNAFRDMAGYLSQSGLPAPIYFRRGERVHAGMRRRSVRVDLGSPVGAQRFNLLSMPEFQEVARRLDDCDVSAYTYLPGVRAAVAATLVALLPMSNERGARLLSHALRGSSLGVGGFIVVETMGSWEGSRLGLTVHMVYGNEQGYWINGLAPAIVARMISEGGLVRLGVHYLANAVDTLAFVTTLRSAGVDVNERWTGSV